MADLLRGCDVKTCAVLDFPGGASSTAERIAEADRAVAEGADEIEIVMNYHAMLAGEFKAVRDDLMRVVRAVRGRAANDARGDVIVKVIIEAPLLNDKVKRLACKIVTDVGADFARTCTGRGTKASVHDVELMRDALPEGVGVKASGGIDTLEAGAGDDRRGRRPRRHLVGRRGDGRAGRPERGRLMGGEATEAIAERVRFGADGLIPAVVQDAGTGRVLTQAWMNRESLERTLDRGETWFWSRSRQELWRKGATSGNTQAVRAVLLDCDGDSLVVLVDPAGPACHTGAETCFGDALTDGDAPEPFAALADLERTVADARRRGRPRVVVHRPAARQGHRHRVQEGGGGGDRGGPRREGRRARPGGLRERRPAVPPRRPLARRRA